MSEEQDYTRELSEIRSMMERSSKFLSLSGWAGIMAGIYALLAAYIAHTALGFRPGHTGNSNTAMTAGLLTNLVLLATVLLMLSIGTAVWLSYRRAARRSEKIWNPTSRRMLQHLCLPLFTGGLIILIQMAQGEYAYMLPFTLIFYGLSLFSAGYFTFAEIRYLGLCQVLLGLLAMLITPYSLLVWAAGFGLLHIAYGIYIHIRHQR